MIDRLPEWLSPQEVADHLGVVRGTVSAGLRVRNYEQPNPTTAVCGLPEKTFSRLSMPAAPSLGKRTNKGIWLHQIELRCQHNRCCRCQNKNNFCFLDNAEYLIA
jgi:hypothetical protein